MTSPAAPSSQSITRQHPLISSPGKTAMLSRDLANLARDFHQRAVKGVPLDSDMLALTATIIDEYAARARQLETGILPPQQQLYAISGGAANPESQTPTDRKSTRLNSSH